MACMTENSETTPWSMQTEVVSTNLCHFLDNHKMEVITLQQITGSPLYDRYLNALEDGAMFDCRAFNVPREEVTNNIYWRQLDASRNSIQMLGQVHFAHKELQNKSCNEIQDMLMTRKGINWNNLPAYQKRGSCCVKRKYFEEQEEDGKLVKVERSHWEVDVNIPIFKGDGREYIEQLLEPEE